MVGATISHDKIYSYHKTAQEYFVSPAWKESFKRSLRLRVSLMRAWLIKSPTAGGLKSSVASIKCGRSGGGSNAVYAANNMLSAAAAQPMEF